MPLAATDNGDGTSTLKVDTELTATIDPTGLATSAKQDTGNSSLSSINAKLPTLVGGKIPVDASVSIDAIDIGNVDITEFPAGNLGQQLKAASLSVAPATDITDATYLGDIKFGESLPAGSAIVGKVGIDQTTPGTTNLVNVNGGTSQTSDIKVTLDSEKVAVSTIDAGTNLIGNVGIDQVTANANEVVVKSQTPPATLPLPTGAATSANQPGLEGTDKAKTSVYVKKSTNADTVLTLGKAADADSLPVALSTEALAALETISLTGSLPDTAATDLAHIHSNTDNLNVGDQAKAASISVTPATDIPDGRYVGDIKFGESLPAGTNLVGVIGLDQTTPGANEVVVKTSALPSGAATAANQVATTINEYNVTLTVVDTEYSQALPASCKGIEFVSRGGYPVRYAFTTGKVAGLTSPYFTLKSNCSYENPATLNLSSKTIYFASDNAGDVVELIAWS